MHVPRVGGVGEGDRDYGSDESDGGKHQRRCRREQGGVANLSGMLDLGIALGVGTWGTYRGHFAEHKSQ